MSNTIPSSIALTTIPANSQIISSTPNSNNSAIQTAVNAIITCLGGGGGVFPKITSSSLAGGPPGSPTDGDIWYATGVDANGTVWVFRYNAGSASSSKWEFVGGPAAMVEVGTAESTTSTTYAALTTAGPSFTCVRAGDYEVEIGANLNNNTNGGRSRMSYDVGGVGAGDGDAIWVTNPASTTVEASLSRKRLKTGLAASTALVSKYKTDAAGTLTAANRWMAVTPVRIA